MGERALLVETASLEDAVALHRSLQHHRPAPVIDLVPAARTVLVIIDPARIDLAQARAWITGTRADAVPPAPDQARQVELSVVYDGEDLDGTAALLGITADELVRRHTAAQWTVAFTGFAPGFAYLTSPDWTVDVPRLPVPRTRVPRGAVGLAAGFTGAYPRETPGGWRLIGTTDAELFDPHAAPPALLAPGTRVRLRAVPPGTAAPARPPAPEQTSAPAALRIVEPGLLASVQDLGRAGHASLGVSSSGALDRSAARTANRLVGNPEGAAVIETTMGGLRAVAERDLWCAVTGAWGTIRVDGREIDPYEAHAWPAGAELSLDRFVHGARGYVAVRGGIDSVPVLGSRATDVLAGLGPRILRAGDGLPVGAEPAVPIPAATVAPWGAPHDDELEVTLAPGPRADWFAASALSDLFETVWTVSAHADRVGMRLEGPALARTRTDELPSEGMVAGAVQVPPGGQPVILLADAPVTGGYPVIAVATDAALDLLAQARPGTRVRFRHAPPA